VLLYFQQLSNGRKPHSNYSRQAARICSQPACHLARWRTLQSFDYRFGRAPGPEPDWWAWPWQVNAQELVALL
jgi:hypothetical protein